MQFNSYEFILIFFPLLFAGYFLLNRWSRTLGRLFLTGMSAWFYLWYGLASAPVLLVSLAINYAAAALIARNEKQARLVLTLDVAANIALLFYYKYTPFVLANVNYFLRTSYRVDVLLPLGISFFTFQQISYVLHVSKTGRNESLLDYLLYILFFPKLIMGPLAEPGELIPQLRDEARARPDAVNIACGLKLFCFGLLKKLLLADVFASAVNWCFGDLASATAADIMLTMPAYVFELYFDFSGYSDMATGIAKVLNIDLPINFDSPFKACSIHDFWKRWHISLTTFLTRNVYIPLGGNRRGTLRQYLNMMTVFFVSGVWHGANWTYILWGLLNGALSVAERIVDRAQIRVNKALGWLGTFLAVNVMWLLFRSNSVGQWLAMLKTMLRCESLSVSPALLGCFEIQETALLARLLHIPSAGAASALLFYAAALLLCLIPENNFRSRDRLTPANAVLAALAFFFAFLHLGGESVFVYFNF